MTFFFSFILGEINGREILIASNKFRTFCHNKSRKKSYSVINTHKLKITQTLEILKKSLIFGFKVHEGGI